MQKKILISFLLSCFVVLAYSQDTTKTKKPKATYIVGAAKVTVWENTGKNGMWKNFKVEKIYKKDDKWMASSYFYNNELLELRAAIDKAIAEENVKVKTDEEK